MSFTSAGGATVRARTFTVNGRSETPSLSNTLTVTVRAAGPLAYVWSCLGIGPGELIGKVVSGEPSPQLTLTIQGPSTVPGSVKLPRFIGPATPANATWSAGAVMIGATLVTRMLAVVEALPWSLSVAVSVTCRCRCPAGRT